MGLFWSSRKCISRHKFENEIEKHLSSIGFTHEEINQVEEIFRSDIDDKDSGCDYAGLVKEEIDAGIAWMHKHKNIHKIPDKKIDELEETLKKYF